MPVVADPVLGLTFLEMQEEVFARGADFLNQDATSRARVKRFVNRGYLEIVDMDRWSFRETTLSGAAPLLITDLGEIESVRVTSEANRRLRGTTRPALSIDLSVTGSPAEYYVTSGDTVATYPSGGTLSVDYWLVPPEMVADADIPIIPSRFRYLVVEAAMRKVYLDSDNPGMAEVARQEMMGGVDLMRLALGRPGEHDRVLVTARDF